MSNNFAWHCAPIAGAGKAGIERRIVSVVLVPVTAGGIALPDLDQRVRHRAIVFVEDPAADDDALAKRVTGVLAREVAVFRPNVVLAE